MRVVLIRFVIIDGLMVRVMDGYEVYEEYEYNSVIVR